MQPAGATFTRLTKAILKSEQQEQKKTQKTTTKTKD